MMNSFDRWAVHPLHADQSRGARKRFISFLLAAHGITHAP
jgi:hypothetical protein